MRSFHHPGVERPLIDSFHFVFTRLAALGAYARLNLRARVAGDVAIPRGDEWVLRLVGRELVLAGLRLKETEHAGALQIALLELVETDLARLLERERAALLLLRLVERLQ